MTLGLILHSISPAQTVKSLSSPSYPLTTFFDSEGWNPSISEKFWLPSFDVLKSLFDVQFHIAYYAKIMSWWDVEHLPLPELELIVRKLNEASEKEEARQKGGNNLQQMAEQFKLQRKLREQGILPEEKKIDPTQQARLNKMRAIHARHPLANPISDSEMVK
jgi:hypothetical protein